MPRAGQATPASPGQAYQSRSAAPPGLSMLQVASQLPLYPFGRQPGLVDMQPGEPVGSIRLLPEYDCTQPPGRCAVSMVLPLLIGGNREAALLNPQRSPLDPHAPARAASMS